MNAAIAERVRAFTGPLYDPQAGARAPLLREYLESTDAETKDLSEPVRMNNSRYRFARVNRFSMPPIRSEKTPPPPKTDCFGDWGLLRIYWQRLKSKGLAGRVNVDHPVSRAGIWPILEAMAREFKRTVHLRWSNEQALIEMFWHDFDDNPENWCLINLMVPMYDAESGGDGISVILFLEQLGHVFDDPDMDLTLPDEWAGHEFSERVICRIRDCLCRDRLSAFPRYWRRPLRLMRDFGGECGYVSAGPEYQQYEISSSDDFDDYFLIFKRYWAMMDASQDLYHAAQDDIDAVWSELFGAMGGPKKSRKKGRPCGKALVEVMA